MSVSNNRLVVFGCGYLGQRVAVEALRRGITVTALTRNLQQAKTLERMGIQKVIVGALEGTEWHAQVDPQQEYVLNCVGASDPGVEGYRKSYLHGTESILKWAAGGEVNTLIFTSSTGVYPQNDGEWVTELDTADGSTEGSRIIRETERLLEARPKGIDRCFSLRLGGIYGPGRHHLLTRALRRESPLENVDDIFLNSIHVQDACRAIWAAFDLASPGDGGVFNIVDDSPTRKGEIARWLMEEVERRGASQVTENQPLAARRRAGPRPNRQISNRRAKEVLGWQPEFTDYRTGYSELLEGML